MTEPHQIDRKAMREAFDRASATYDEAAVLQARVREELLDRLPLVPIDPALVLDLGAATGAAARQLQSAYPRALVVAVDLAPEMLRSAAAHTAALCADALSLPFADESIDLVYSNLMLQWCDEPGAVFREVHRVLRAGGFFTFSTFGPDTLRELRAAWSQADRFSHVNRFVDMHDLGDALVQAGLSEPVMDVERVCLTYADVHALMRDLKAIGAHNVTAGRARGLTGRKRFARMTEAYEPARQEGRLPATYEVVYGAAWRGEHRGAYPVQEGEARIPLGAIRRRGP